VINFFIAVIQAINFFNCLKALLLIYLKLCNRETGANNFA